jgi:hypothetical protein
MTGGGAEKKKPRRGLPGLRVEVDAERLAEISVNPTLDPKIWSELKDLAESILENTRIINEKVSRDSNYAFAE